MVISSNNNLSGASSGQTIAQVYTIDNLLKNKSSQIQSVTYKVSISNNGLYWRI